MNFLRKLGVYAGYNTQQVQHKNEVVDGGVHAMQLCNTSSSDASPLMNDEMSVEMPTFHIKTRTKSEKIQSLSGMFGVSNVMKACLINIAGRTLHCCSIHNCCTAVPPGRENDGENMQVFYGI